MKTRGFGKIKRGILGVLLTFCQGFYGIKRGQLLKRQRHTLLIGLSCRVSPFFENRTRKAVDFVFKASTFGDGFSEDIGQFGQVF